MRALDHIVICAGRLDEGVAAVEAALGVRLQPGGKHAYMGTHNALLGLGPQAYLEVIAIDPDAPAPGHPRWFGLDAFSGRPRLAAWVLRVGALDAALTAAPEGAGHPVSLARGDFRWRMGVPADGLLPFDNAFPALIQWQEGLHPCDRLPDAGCRLARLDVSHPDAAALRRAVALDDPHVHFAEGPKALRATIATPHGTRVLE